MTGYKLATLQEAEGPRAAVVVEDIAYDAARMTGVSGYVSVQGILDDWDRAHPRLEAAAARPGIEGTPLSAAVLLAPLPRPGVIYCAGANYRDHAEEMSHLSGKPPQDPRANGARPWFFLKAPHSVAAPGATLEVTRYSATIDWEAELVAVIGRVVHKVSVEEALGSVAGFTCGNDLSARDQAFRAGLPESSTFRADWMRHKSFDGACPIGPWIVPAPYISDPDALSIRLWVNDAPQQDSSTAQMIFSIAEQVASLSEGITLHPGDLVMTGTPAGVGMSKGQFLKPGDRLRVEISEIGALHNLVS